MITEAFWVRLDMSGTVFSEHFSTGTHIQRLFENIEAFPIEVKTIQEIYAVNGEPIPTTTNLPLDGVAAHKIIMLMLQKGFLTIRYHCSSKTVHVNAWKRTKSVDRVLSSWCEYYADKFSGNPKVIFNQFYMNAKQPVTMRLNFLNLRKLVAIGNSANVTNKLGLVEVAKLPEG